MTDVESLQSPTTYGELRGHIESEVAEECPTEPLLAFDFHLSSAVAEAIDLTFAQLSPPTAGEFAEWLIRLNCHYSHALRLFSDISPVWPDSVVIEFADGVGQSAALAALDFVENVQCVLAEVGMSVLGVDELRDSSMDNLPVDDSQFTRWHDGTATQLRDSERQTWPVNYTPHQVEVAFRKWKFQYWRELDVAIQSKSNPQAPQNNASHALNPSLDYRKPLGDMHPLKVDVAKCTITLGKSIFEVNSENALRWIRVLAEHPSERISGRELENYDKVLINVRPDLLKKYLPDEVLDLIETNRKGSRLNLRARINSALRTYLHNAVCGMILPMSSPASTDRLAALRDLSLAEVEARLADLDAERAALSVIRRSLAARDRAAGRNQRQRPKENAAGDDRAGGKA